MPISILLWETGQWQSNRVRYESSWGNLFNITQSELPSQKQSHFVGVWRLAAALRARNTLIFTLQRRKWVNIVVGENDFMILDLVCVGANGDNELMIL